MRRSTSRPPTASRLAVQSNSCPAHPDLAGPGQVGGTLGPRPPGSGRSRPMTTVLPALTIPALSGAIPSRVGPEHLGVVEAHVGEHRHLGVHHVRAVPGPAEAHLDHRDVDRLVGEPRAAPPPSAARTGWAARRAAAPGRPARPSTSVRASSSIGSPSRGQALVHPGEVGAGVGADAQPDGPEQRGDHGRGRALAVGAGQVDGRGRPARGRPAGRPARASARGWAGRGGWAPWTRSRCGASSQAERLAERGERRRWSRGRRSGGGPAAPARLGRRARPPAPGWGSPGRAPRPGRPRTCPRRCGSAGRT